MPIRLTLLIDSLAPGGAQTQIVRLAAGLDPADWSVRLAWYNQTARFLQVPPGVTAVPLPRSHRLDPRFALAMRRLVSRAETDLVHAWLPAPALYATLAAQLPGSARVLTAVRCSPSLFENAPMQGRMTTLAARLAASTTSNSRASIAWLKQRGVHSGHMHFIGNALDPAIVHREPSTPQARADLLASLGLDPLRPPIVSLGRFDAYKNQDGLVRALIKVRDRGLAVPPLLLAGFLEDQARVAHVRQLASDARLEVHIVPAVTDVATLLEAAQFSVLASRSEGTPNVVLEALGLGTLVVSTRVGEVAALVTDSHTGLLCEPESDEALAHALERALLLPQPEVLEFGRRARADMLARYSPTAVVGQYTAVYHSVLGKK
jgi:glycosyltransferase involved in cell wall biosynthesis